LADDHIFGFLEIQKKGIPPIQGETQDSRFKKKQAIEVLSFSLSCGHQPDKDSDDSDIANLSPIEQKRRGISASDVLAAKDKAKSAGSKPKGEEKTFEISKYLDAASPALFVSYCQGLKRPVDKDAKIDKAILTLMKHGVYGGKTQHLKYLIMYFEGLYVRSYSLDAEFPYPTEKVTFSFQKCMLRYTPQNWAGESLTALNGGWDFQVVAGQEGGMWYPEWADPEES